MRRLMLVCILFVSGCSTIKGMTPHAVTSKGKDASSATHLGPVEPNPATSLSDRDSNEGEAGSSVNLSVGKGSEATSWAIGLTVDEARDEARSRGLDFRVCMINGKGLPATADVRPDRLSVGVTDGQVVSADLN